MKVLIILSFHHSFSPEQLEIEITKFFILTASIGVKMISESSILPTEPFRTFFLEILP
jgi:hypothetical protein